MNLIEHLEAVHRICDGLKEATPKKAEELIKELSRLQYHDSEIAKIKLWIKGVFSESDLQRMIVVEPDDLISLEDAQDNSNEVEHLEARLDDVVSDKEDVAEDLVRAEGELKEKEGKIEDLERELKSSNEELDRVSRLARPANGGK